MKECSVSGVILTVQSFNLDLLSNPETEKMKPRERRQVDRGFGFFPDYPSNELSSPEAADFDTAPTTTTSTDPPEPAAPSGGQTFSFPPARCGCPFTKQFDPICGTDGNTYHNPSVLRCYVLCGASGKFDFILGT